MIESILPQQLIENLETAKRHLQDLISKDGDRELTPEEIQHIYSIINNH